MNALEKLNEHNKTLTINPNLLEVEKKKIERDIDEFKTAGLSQQADILTKNVRLSAANAVGLKPMSITEACRAMTGAKWGYKRIVRDRSYTEELFEWHLDQGDFDKRTGYRRSKYMRPIRVYRYPLYQTGKDMLIAPMSALKIAMPKGILYLTNELKGTKLFDFFVAVAPISCFSLRPQPVDPVILAVIGSIEEITNWQTYFVGMWK
jgi:hypothetical protein